MAANGIERMIGFSPPLLPRTLCARRGAGMLLRSRKQLATASAVAFGRDARTAGRRGFGFFVTAYWAGLWVRVVYCTTTLPLAAPRGNGCWRYSRTAVCANAPYAAARLDNELFVPRFMA